MRIGYDSAIARVLIYPFVHYVRGDYFARAGYSEEAAADFANLLQYAGSDPEVLALAETLTDAYPISGVPFQQWMGYPVIVSGFGPGGIWAVDESQLEASSVQAAIVSDGQRLITYGLGMFLQQNYDENTPQYLNMIAQPDGTYYYFLGYNDEYGDFGQASS